MKKRAEIHGGSTASERSTQYEAPSASIAVSLHNHSSGGRNPLTTSENTINSARKVPKTKDAGAKFSPKKKGGVRSEQEERVGNKIIIASSNSSMKRGGQIK